MTRGKTYDEINLGDSAELTVALTPERVEQFAAASGDRNPLHFDDAAAQAAGFPARIAHGVLTLGLCSAVLGTALPGPGTIAVGLDVKFLRPVPVGDTVTARVEALAKDDRRRTVTMGLSWKNAAGKRVCTGTATVIPPK